MSPASVFSNAKIRQGAFALAVAGVTALTAITGVSSAQAQEPMQIAGVTLDTDCSKYKVGELFEDTQCEIYKSQLLQQQASSEQRLAGCIDFLKGEKSRGVVFPERITRDNACKIADQLGMQQG